MKKNNNTLWNDSLSFTEKIYKDYTLTVLVKFNHVCGNPLWLLFRCFKNAGGAKTARSKQGVQTRAVFWKHGVRSGLLVLKVKSLSCNKQQRNKNKCTMYVDNPDTTYANYNITVKKRYIQNIIWPGPVCSFNCFWMNMTGLIVPVCRKD